MNISQFIDNVVAGNAAAAKENLNDVLSARAFEAIDDQKKELAKSLFGGNSEESEVEVQNTEEVTDDEETYAENVEHDSEQIDEVSLKLASSVYKQRKADAQDSSAGFPNPNRDSEKQWKKSGEHKISTSRNAILKKSGGVTRLKRLNTVMGK